MKLFKDKALMKIAVTAVLFALCAVAAGNARYLYLIPYIFIAWDVLKKAGKNILRGRIFDENFLMAVASLGAVAIGEYPEAVAVVLFYEIGEYFESVAVDRSRKSIAGLMELRPDTAFIEEDGEIRQADPYEVSVGDIIVVRPGEKIPVDGTIVSGQANIDTKAMTGESVPRFAAEGEHVISGCVVLDGLLRIKAEKEFDESTVSKILEMVENSSLNKAKSEDFITKFARWYTPAVVISAVIIALVPLVFRSESFADWINRALIFLVVSCPCALVVSVPLTFFGGIGGASKKGVLIKGSNHLEDLAKVKIAVFDKTGTLTKGEFDIVKSEPVDCTEDELIYYAALAEHFSVHPISLAIKKRCPDITDDKVKSFRDITGKGICAETEAGTIYAGNKKLMDELGIEVDDADTAATAVYVAVGGRYKGALYLADMPKENAKKAIAALKDAGVKKTVMLTGDNEAAAEDIAGKLGIDQVKSRLLPGDKVSALEEILKTAGKNEKVLYTGDGINDAPVIMRADVGAAMGALGSDAALEAADIVLMNDDIMNLTEGIRISKKTGKIVAENIVMALGVKFTVLILSAAGIADNMWLAVFSDVGVLILAILNAIRTLKG